MNKKTEITERYNKDHVKRFAIKLNRKTDYDILCKLAEIENIQGYIKDLIRHDIQLHPPSVSIEDFNPYPHSRPNSHGDCNACCNHRPTEDGEPKK